MSSYILTGYFTPDTYVGTTTGKPPEEAPTEYEGTVTAATSSTVTSSNTNINDIDIVGTTQVVIIRADGTAETATVTSISNSTIFINGSFTLTPTTNDSVVLKVYTSSAIISSLQTAEPSAVIELFEVHLIQAIHGQENIWRFHSGSSLNANGEIYWRSNSYTRFPIQADGFSYESKQMPRPTLQVSNIFGTITGLMLTVNGTTANNDLCGAKFYRIRTLAKYLDANNFLGGVNPYGTPDPNAEFPREIFTITRKTSENRDMVTFELASALDLANCKIPKRVCTRVLFPALGTLK
tara:strand:- start:600 stop:1484 length:885 start_codon:yes stop_codon:yes gene_type:complete